MALTERIAACEIEPVEQPAEYPPNTRQTATSQRDTESGDNPTDNRGPSSSRQDDVPVPITVPQADEPTLHASSPVGESFLALLNSSQ